MTSVRAPVRAVIFDIGGVLVDWDPRFLYERMLPPGDALEELLAHVVTPTWHFQHDAGRAFADTSRELIAAWPQHRDSILAWGPRFLDGIRGRIAGMPELLARLDANGVPLFAITNFSAEFWPPFAHAHADMIDRFRAVVVSGREGLVKPDPAIYALALARFGLAAGEAAFVDDRADNVAAADACGMTGIRFTDAGALAVGLRALGLPA